MSVMKLQLPSGLETDDLSNVITKFYGQEILIDRIAHRIVRILEARFKMTSKTVGKMKSKTDPKTGRTKLTRVHTYDASAKRKIAKSKARKVVSPARAAARGR